MSTFLITVAVVVMSIAAATAVAIRDPDQPATLRGRKHREARAIVAGGSAAARLWWRRRQAIFVDRRRERARARAAAEMARTAELRVGVDAGRRGRTDLLEAEPGAGAEAAADGHFTDGWQPIRAATPPWVRMRSGFVLTILLTLVGIIVAAVVGGVLVAVAIALRSAVS